MPRYLIDEIEGKENIHVHNRTQVLEVRGDGRLERLTIRGPDDETVDATGLFDDRRRAAGRVAPPEVERDERGFVVLKGRRTGRACRGSSRSATTVPGSVKQVASAVGEGSVVIQHVHRYLESVERTQPS